MSPKILPVHTPYTNNFIIISVTSRLDYSTSCTSFTFIDAILEGKILDITLVYYWCWYTNTLWVFLILFSPDLVYPWQSDFKPFQNINTVPDNTMRQSEIYPKKERSQTLSVSVNLVLIHKSLLIVNQQNQIPTCYQQWII